MSPDPTPHGHSDAALVARAVGGDRAALEALVRRHYRTAFAVALAITREVADAEDVAQEALMRAVTRLESCRRPDRFREWVGTIARNAARSRVARDPARRREARLTRLTPSTTDSTRDLDRAELRRRMDAAVAQLPEAQRTVILLHDLDGWSHAEIAAHLGTSAGMCRQYLFKARRALRGLLGLTLLREYRDG
jgi:RNA polymerase sigma-70 factor (ECF subfamily)